MDAYVKAFPRWLLLFMLINRIWSSRCDSIAVLINNVGSQYFATTAISNWCSRAALGSVREKAVVEQQRVQRSYQTDVLSQIERFKARFDVREYGQLNYANQHYPLYAVLTAEWTMTNPRC